MSHQIADHVGLDNNRRLSCGSFHHDFFFSASAEGVENEICSRHLNGNVCAFQQRLVLVVCLRGVHQGSTDNTRKLLVLCTSTYNPDSEVQVQVGYH